MNLPSPLVGEGRKPNPGLRRLFELFRIRHGARFGGATSGGSTWRCGEVFAILANNWISIIGLFLIGGLLVIASIWNWDYWSETTFDDSHKIREIKIDRTKIIQQLLLIVGGFAAFVLASWRTWTAHRQAGTALEQVKVALRQADLAERAHNIDRYTRAANMLDSDQIAVRQAAVYTLLELGRADTANFYNLVIRLLAGFARARSAEFTRHQAERDHQRKLRQYSFPSPQDKLEVETDETVAFSDLYDAISGIGLLREQYPNGVEAERTAKFTLNLSGIVGARRAFAEVDFSSTNLREADFTGAHLRELNFAGLTCATQIFMVLTPNHRTSRTPCFRTRN